MNDNSNEYRSGASLLAAWSAQTREAKLERACKALMAELERLHIEYEEQSLAENINNPSIYCSCADAYRMGHEALR